MGPLYSLLRLSALTVLLGGFLPGCAPGPFAEHLPGELALPAGTPERPTAPYQYPAVHDLPPQRQHAPLDEFEQKRLESELIRARERQSGRAARSNADDTEKQQPSGAKQ